MNNARGALHGVRVFDLSNSIAGQFCGRMLCDFGAEVTLVEPPGGSATRRQGSFRDTQGSESLVFFHNNTGKSSVTLDPSTAAGHALLAALLRDADAVIAEPGMDLRWLRDGNPGHAFMAARMSRSMLRKPPQRWPTHS